jgi:CRISPR-associated protein Cas5d
MLKPIPLWLSGSFACFTRPEFGVERVSYDVITPSAAGNICEAIFWKPEMRYRILSISILRPIKTMSIVRNEINERQSERAAKNWKKGEGFFAGDKRSQRHSLILRNVAYVINVDIDLAPHSTDNVAKYRDQFQRRMKRGQCFHRPYLGCREYAAAFDTPPEGWRVEPINRDFGFMLFDIDIKKDPRGAIQYRDGVGDSRGIVNGSAMPKFFHAVANEGVIKVPQNLYSQEFP